MNTIRSFRDNWDGGLIFVFLGTILTLFGEGVFIDNSSNWLIHLGQACVTFGFLLIFMQKRARNKFSEWLWYRPNWASNSLPEESIPTKLGLLTYLVVTIATLFFIKWQLTTYASAVHWSSYFICAGLLWKLGVILFQYITSLYIIWVWRRDRQDTLLD